jgi:hypothetical protein
MNDEFEKKYAGHMLHHKEHGYSILYILRVSALRYLLLFALVALVLVLNSINRNGGGMTLFLLGLLVGSVLRDFGSFRQGRKIWPLYDKVIDWEKVREIADKGSNWRLG